MKNCCIRFIILIGGVIAINETDRETFHQKKQEKNTLVAKKNSGTTNSQKQEKKCEGEKSRTVLGRNFGYGMGCPPK